MNRNSLVIESLKKPAGARSVWSMCLTMIGAAFGAPDARHREPGR